LIEVLVAAMVLVIGVLALLTVLDTANQASTAVRARDGASNLARQVTESARLIPYSTLTPQAVEAELQDLDGLSSEGGGAGWTLQRRGFAYTVSATACTVDDPADGMGVHDAGVYCSNTGAAGTADHNPDDYKRITADVTWALHGVNHTIHQVGVVNNPGSAVGPAVTNLSIVPPATPLIVSNLLGAALTATTSAPASSVAFSVDGVPSAAGTGLSMLWNYTWPISNLVDGTHLVTAQAFDTQGLSGATRSVTVKLNRFLPSAPTGLVGGRNGSVVDLEWLPNPELDIAGYRVFRQPLIGAPQLVCPLAAATACQDTSPPAGALLTYFVVADDLDASGVYRDGLPSLPATVLSTNRPPNSPTLLTATQANGATTLSWTAAVPADPDFGDGVAFYRIYRDGIAFANRYDRTGAGTELSYVDGRTDGTSHQYWITAVDKQLAESPRLGPVTQ
jgi:Tfp pilus assembly protein PilV